MTIVIIVDIIFIIALIYWLWPAPTPPVRFHCLHCWRDFPNTQSLGWHTEANHKGELLHPDEGCSVSEAVPMVVVSEPDIKPAPIPEPEPQETIRSGNVIYLIRRVK